jgi:hypothetical protein
MSKKIRKYIFPGTAIAATAYASTTFALGAILAYFATELYCNKLIKKGKVRPIIFDIKGWHIHFHHWIWPIMFIVGAYILGLIYSMPVIFIGALGGLISHDIYTDKKWAEVVGETKPWYKFITKNPR